MISRHLTAAPQVETILPWNKIYDIVCPKGDKEPLFHGQYNDLVTMDFDGEIHSLKGIGELLTYEQINNFLHHKSTPEKDFRPLMRNIAAMTSNLTQFLDLVMLRKDNPANEVSKLTPDIDDSIHMTSKEGHHLRAGRNRPDGNWYELQGPKDSKLKIVNYQKEAKAHKTKSRFLHNEPNIADWDKGYMINTTDIINTEENDKYQCLRLEVGMKDGEELKAKIVKMDGDKVATTNPLDYTEEDPEVVKELVEILNLRPTDFIKPAQS